MDAIRFPTLIRRLLPKHYRHAQRLDNARAMLLVNGLITKQQSEQIRRKLRDKLNSERANHV